MQSLNDAQDRTLKEFSALRQWTGPVKEFWPRYVSGLASLSNANRVILLRQGADGAAWKKFADWSAGPGGSSRIVTAFMQSLEQMAKHCTETGARLSPLEEGGTRYPNHYVAAVQLDHQPGGEICAAILLLSEVTETFARESLLRAKLVADIPKSFLASLAIHQAKVDVEKLAVALDLMVEVNEQKRFLAAAFAFCNGLANRFSCDRVSLGWLEGSYVRLRAISRTEKFDRHMAVVSLLEAAMEEALDQDEEIIWPAPEQAQFVTLDHAKFARDQSLAHLCSLPLRLEDKSIAVLTCERQSKPFSLIDLQQLRLCCDQATRRLSDLHQYEGWFGARWARHFKERLARWVGPEHTWAKLLALGITLALAALFLVRLNYRVEGNFILKSDETAYLTAPFDGYISQVFVRSGDPVTQGGNLLSLNTAELRLEELAAMADLNRYQREAEKARASKTLAEMRVAQAMAEQAQARLDLVRYRLGQAEIKSPLAGIVVEGDLRDRLGAPVKQGDALFKISRIDSLYLEAQVPERDVHEILHQRTGEIAFVSQPKLKFPVRIEVIEAAATPMNNNNVFLVRCRFEEGLQPWWRPGMSGLCKLNVEKRSLFWILTHRTTDFLRMWLWW